MKKYARRFAFNKNNCYICNVTKLYTYATDDDICLYYG